MKRQRTSLSMATASRRVLSWQQQSSTRARPSTACSTAEWELRSAGARVVPLGLACNSWGRDRGEGRVFI